jgi:DNA (cytosine-5)-methyltransferase 1
MSETDSLDLPGRTMLTSEGNVNRSTHILIDPVLNVKRFITPIEAERLQDFPDNWTDTDMPFRRRYFMMGNALVTGIINRLEHNLSVIIENE